MIFKLGFFCESLQELGGHVWMKFYGYLPLVVLCNDCAPKSFGESSVVCVCNSTYCDTLNLNPDGIPEGSYVMYTSSKDGLRFDSRTQKFSVAEGNSGKLYVHVSSESKCNTREFRTRLHTDEMCCRASGDQFFHHLPVCDRLRRRHHRCCCYQPVPSQQ